MELRDPKVRAIIREGYKEFLAGKTRPIEEFFADRHENANVPANAQRHDAIRVYRSPNVAVSPAFDKAPQESPRIRSGGEKRDWDSLHGSL